MILGRFLAGHSNIAPNSSCLSAIGSHFRWAILSISGPIESESGSAAESFLLCSQQTTTLPSLAAQEDGSFSGVRGLFTPGPFQHVFARCRYGTGGDGAARRFEWEGGVARSFPPGIFSPVPACWCSTTASSRTVRCFRTRPSAAASGQSLTQSSTAYELTDGCAGLHRVPLMPTGGAAVATMALASPRGC